MGPESLFPRAIISHVGIAVADIEKSSKLYTSLLGYSPQHEELVADQHVRVVMFSGREGDDPMSHGRIELVAATSPESPIHRFIQTHGEGLHHICIYVDDIVAKLAELKESGVRLIDESPRVGAEGKRIAFVHPSSMGGVLIELEERSK